MSLPVPWQSSDYRRLESPHTVAALIEALKESIDFEGNTTAIDHFIAGDKIFVGQLDI